MAVRGQVQGDSRGSLFSAIVTAALTAVIQPVFMLGAGVKQLALFGNLTYGSGGTSADAYIQTSIDGGTTWFDIANFHFTTSTAGKLSVVTWDPATPFTAATALAAGGSLTANTILNGIIGDRVRALVTTVGTYAGGTTLAVSFVAKG